MSCLVFLLLGFGLGGAVNGALRDALAELRRQRAEAAQLEAEVVSIRSLLEQGEPALRRARILLCTVTHCTCSCGRQLLHRTTARWCSAT